MIHIPLLKPVGAVALAAMLLSIIGCTNRGTVPMFSPVNSMNLSRNPGYCPLPGFVIKPAHVTVPVRARVTLDANYVWWSGSQPSCFWHSRHVSAEWTKSGGHLQPSSGHEVTFYATNPGRYRVSATYNQYDAHVDVKVVITH